MRWQEVFPFVCGYEQVGGQIRLYLDGPSPTVCFSRQRGVRTNLFRLYSGEDAASLLAWLDRHRAWQCLRVPPRYTRERGVRAVLLAADWHGGERTGLFRLARTRVIADDAHREQLGREVRLLIGVVLENPVRDGEFARLQTLEDVVQTAPTGVELATAAEVLSASWAAG